MANRPSNEFVRLRTETIRGLYVDRQLSKGAIAETLHICKETVRKALRRASVSTRPFQPRKICIKCERPVVHVPGKRHTDGSPRFYGDLCRLHLAERKRVEKRKRENITPDRWKLKNL
jgi:hypothetical protein